MVAINTAKANSNAASGTVTDTTTKSMDEIAKKKLKDDRGSNTGTPVYQTSNTQQHSNMPNLSLSLQGGMKSLISKDVSFDKRIENASFSGRPQANIKYGDEKGQSGSAFASSHANEAVPANRINTKITAPVLSHKQVTSLEKNENINPANPNIGNVTSLEKSKIAVGFSSQQLSHIVQDSDNTRNKIQTLGLGNRLATDSSQKITTANADSFQNATNGDKVNIAATPTLKLNIPEKENPLPQGLGSGYVRTQSTNEQRIDAPPKNIGTDAQHTRTSGEKLHMANASAAASEAAGKGNSNLTYTFSDWGKGHQVNIQIVPNQGLPIVLNPSDALVHQRLSDHGGQQNQGQPDWVFQDEHEQSQDARQQPKQDEEQM